MTDATRSNLRMIVLLFAVIFLLFWFVDHLTAQTQMGPVTTPRINQDLFVGQLGFPTIQSAVTYGCATGNHRFRVVVPAGSTPPDTPTGATGGCANTYIADQRTSTPANYQWSGSAYASVPLGSAILPTPQNRLILQPNPGTDTVGGPATTSTNATAPILNGQANTDLFATGAGNNGMTNYFATCGANCFGQVPGTSTSTERPGGLYNSFFPIGSHIIDYRSGSANHYIHNPSYLWTPCNDNDTSGFASTMGGCIYDLKTGNTDNYFQRGSLLRVAGHSYNNGNNGTSGQGWGVYKGLWLENHFETRGIAEGITIWNVGHYAGDGRGIYARIMNDGGAIATSDEGQNAVVGQVFETGAYFTGACLTGCTTGSNLITTQLYDGQNAVTDQSLLINWSKPLAATGTYLYFGYTYTYNTLYYSGVTLPVSTAWGFANSATTGTADGKYQIGVPQTITFTFGTSPASPGAFTVGKNACIIDYPGTDPNNGVAGGYASQVEITAVGAVSAGQQSVTFLTRYGYHAQAMMMQGGMCGYAVMNQASTDWPNVLLTIGSFSSNQVVTAACALGNCNSRAMDDALGLTAGGNTVKWYPAAEVIGTNGGQQNTVELANNTIPFAVGDVLKDPHIASQQNVGGKFSIFQRTPIGPGGAYAVIASYTGANATRVGNAALYVGFITDPIHAGIQLLANGGYYDTMFDIMEPSNCVICEEAGVDHDKIFYRSGFGGNTIRTLHGGGGFDLSNASNGLPVPIFGKNIPNNIPTNGGQLSTSYDSGAGDYRVKLVTLTGDATIDGNSGVMTVAKINGVSVTGTPAAGYVPVATSSTAATWQPGGGGGGIAPITIALSTGAIAAGTCTSPATASMTGLLTTSAFSYPTFATSPAGTGWDGNLNFKMWPTANTVHYMICNFSAASITPDPMTINLAAR